MSTICLSSDETEVRSTDEVAAGHGVHAGRRGAALGQRLARRAQLAVLPCAHTLVSVAAAHTSATILITPMHIQRYAKPNSIVLIKNKLMIRTPITIHSLNYYSISNISRNDDKDH